MNAIRTRLPSPALPVAGVALVVALGGVSYAAGVLPNNSVGTAQLKKTAVSAAKLKRTPSPRARSARMGSRPLRSRAAPCWRTTSRPASSPPGLRVPPAPSGRRATLALKARRDRRAYGTVRINGAGNFELVPGTTKNVIALAQAGGGNAAACIQLDSSIDAANARAVATPNLIGGYNTHVLVHRPVGYCAGALSNALEVITTRVDNPGAAVKWPFVFAVM
jgi:hypothetical protein